MIVGVLRQDAGRYILSFVNQLRQVQYTLNFIVQCKWQRVSPLH